MNRHAEPTLETKVGWRPSEWARDTGLSRSSTYRLLKDGTVEFVKSGNATIIVTTPAEYLASLVEARAS